MKHENEKKLLRVLVAKFILDEEKKDNPGRYINFNPTGIQLEKFLNSEGWIHIPVTTIYEKIPSIRYQDIKEIFTYFGNKNWCMSFTNTKDLDKWDLSGFPAENERMLLKTIKTESCPTGYRQIIHIAFNPNNEKLQKFVDENADLLPLQDEENEHVEQYSWTQILNTDIKLCNEKNIIKNIINNNEIHCEYRKDKRTNKTSQDREMEYAFKVLSLFKGSVKLLPKEVYKDKLGIINKDPSQPSKYRTAANKILNELGSEYELCSLRGNGGLKFVKR